MFGAQIIKWSLVIILFVILPIVLTRFMVRHTIELRQSRKR